MDSDLFLTGETEQKLPDLGILCQRANDGHLGGTGQGAARQADEDAEPGHAEIDHFADGFDEHLSQQMGSGRGGNILLKAPLTHDIPGYDARGHAYRQGPQHNHRIDGGIGGEKTANPIHGNTHESARPRSEEDAGKNDADILQSKPIIDGHGKQILSQDPHHHGDRRQHGEQGDKGGFVVAFFIFWHNCTSECLSSLLQSEI